MKRIVIIALLLLTSAVASARNSLPVANDNAAAVRASQIVVQYKLTSLTPECLYFDTNDEGSDYLIRVREKHSVKCGGDLETSPTVLFMKLRKKDGHATTTAYGTDGDFQELK